jgi:putative ABC transport system permease protein
MQHWLQLSTRHWITRPGRSMLNVLAIALGVAVVTWVTCCYESVRQSITSVVLEWIGRSHIIVEPVDGVWGFFDGSIEPSIAAIPGVEHTTMRTREYIFAAPLRPGGTTQPSDELFVRIEVAGIVPQKEEDFRTYPISSGRFLSPDHHDEILVEKILAKEFELDVGGKILLRDNDPPGPARVFTVVGIVDRRRASINQAAMTWAPLEDVQSLCGLPGKVKGVDVILTDRSVANIQATAEQIRALAPKDAPAPPGGRKDSPIEVKTTEAQHNRLGAAQGLLQFIIMLLACVVLLTALFIILASMGMGISEQITQLGLLRCIGVTRMQLALIVLCQAAPLGLMGTLLGVPMGIGLQWITMRVAGDYLGQMAVSHWGIALAVFGGFGTTLVGAAIPACTAFLVSPVDAARPHAGGRLTHLIWYCAILGILFVVGHEWLKSAMGENGGHGFGTVAVVDVLMLYAGFALLTPAVVSFVGRAAVAVASGVLRLRPQLLGEEINKSPFRAAAICSGLMVALSLIVGLVVWAGSVKAGWQFPKEFPDALLYSYNTLPLDEVRKLKNVPGITQFTVADDFGFSFTRPTKFNVFKALQIGDPSQRCLAIEPDEGFDIVKLAFLEGSQRDALAKLKQGGHILVTREFSLARKKHLGDSLDIWVDQTKATFTIAGVIASPGLDIAISFFNASEYFQFYAVGAVIMSLADAEKQFDRRYGKLMLFNFAFVENDKARVGRVALASEAPKASTTPGARPNFEMGSGPVAGDSPEERIVNEMLKRLGYPPKAFVTARELKQQIDRNIDRVTMLLSAIPLVGLVIGALGVANLMAANVASRRRQIAVMRAIGVTRSQMMRIVIGEALVLGLLGSVMGLVLGVCLGRTSNFMTRLLSGYEPQFDIPWLMVGAGAVLATVLCLLAAIGPARSASRSNIVAVLSS